MFGTDSTKIIWKKNKHCVQSRIELWVCVLFCEKYIVRLFKIIHFQMESTYSFSLTNRLKWHSKRKKKCQILLIDANSIIIDAIEKKTNNINTKTQLYNNIASVSNEYYLVYTVKYIIQINGLHTVLVGMHIHSDRFPPSKLKFPLSKDLVCMCTDHLLTYVWRFLIDTFEIFLTHSHTHIQTHKKT